MLDRVDLDANGHRDELEFEAVMVLPKIVRNYGNYLYGN